MPPAQPVLSADAETAQPASVGPALTVAVSTCRLPALRKLTW